MTDLPEPDSPTRPRHSPCSRSKETPSTARTLPYGVSKRTARSRTLSRGSATVQSLPLNLGSRASRRPSPSTFNASKVEAMAKAGKTTSHQ